MQGRIRSLQVKARARGEHGIPKHAVSRIHVTTAGVDGDYNKYRAEKLRSDPGHALLLLPHETLLALAAEGWAVAAGDLGENVTTEGLAYDAFAVGARVTLGEALVEIAEPCVPCSTLRVLPYVGREKLRSFVATLRGRRGWYARVVTAGAVRVGDSVVVAR